MSRTKIAGFGSGSLGQRPGSVQNVGILNTDTNLREQQPKRDGFVIQIPKVLLHVHTAPVDSSILRTESRCYLVDHLKKGAITRFTTG
jgi:hypothetical protein